MLARPITITGMGRSCTNPEPCEAPWRILKFRRIKAAYTQPEIPVAVIHQYQRQEKAGCRKADKSQYGRQIGLRWNTGALPNKYLSGWRAHKRKPTLSRKARSSSAYGSLSACPPAASTEMTGRNPPSSTYFPSRENTAAT